MLDSIAASTACEPATGAAIRATCRQMVREQIPNLLRLHLNPHVAQTCYCLTHWIESCWPLTSAENYQVFLANSLEEALSGAIKLARYTAGAEGTAGAGLAIDYNGRLEHFAATELSGLGTLQYIPEVQVLADPLAALGLLERRADRPGFVVAFLSTLRSLDEAAYRRFGEVFSAAGRPFLIVCADHSSLTDIAAGRTRRELSPDIVVFDESFVEFAVPFGAFAASQRLYRHWNQRGMATFHSTTFQPNTISNLHFMRCLRARNPAFVNRHAVALERIDHDLLYRRSIYRQFYSRSLARLIAAVGLDQRTLRAAGHYVETSRGRLLDAVAGVACSIRGHNPPTYVDDIEATPPDIDDCRQEIAERLHALTGLPYFTPAVSGAGAVEQALKLALASQYPRNYVLALAGGFAGKTLFALTGTWNPKLRAGLAPLYPHVVFVDPFADDAVAALEAACERYPVAVIQFELIQAVGGVRALPPAVRACLARLRERYGCLLLADEVQTGMWRTGPFVRSRAWDIQPDLLTLGKGTSDMMFPCSLTLHSERVEQLLDERGCSLVSMFHGQYGYELGLRTVLATLRRAEDERLAERVQERGELLARLLGEQLGSCGRVRELRSFGLLTGIELAVGRRWKRLLPQAALLAMMRHKTFPVIAGFCQCEPQVLKLTPPLSITEDEIRAMCATIAAVLRRSTAGLALSGAWQMAVAPRLARLPGRGAH